MRRATVAASAASAGVARRMDGTSGEALGECGGELGAGGVGVVLEVDPGLVPRLGADLRRPGIEFGRSVGRLVEAEIAVWRGGADDGLGVLALGGDERHLMLAEQGADVVGEPGGVAELQGGFPAPGNERQERREALEVELHVGRKLEQRGAALVAERVTDAEEVTHHVVRVLEAGMVGDALGRLDAEGEPVGDGRGPFDDDAFLGHAVEGVVDLDRGETRRVVREHLGRRQGLGVEGTLPLGEGVAAGADVDAHGGSVIGRAVD